MTPEATVVGTKPAAVLDETEGSQVSRLIGWRDVFPNHRLFATAKSVLIIGIGAYLAGARFSFGTVGASMALVALLWAALYALNEFTDLTNEQKKVGSPLMQVLLFAAPVAICAATLGVSRELAGLMALMTVSQVAYCMWPLRLKRYWWAIIVLGGVLNPLLRLQCGAIWGVHPVSSLAYVALVGLQLGCAIRMRMLRRDRDARVGYQVSPAGSGPVGMAATGVGFVGLYAVCLENILPRHFVVFATVALVFAVYAWSGRTTSMAQVRKGWLWFAILSLCVLALLLDVR